MNNLAFACVIFIAIIAGLLLINLGGLFGSFIAFILGGSLLLYVIISLATDK